MRFSAVAALCAAPLALAGTLQQDLVARGAVSVEAGVSVESSESQGNKDSKSQSNGHNRNSGDNVVVESQSGASITEVIIIWVNNGGGLPTSTVQAQSTIAGAAAPPGSQATHQVSWVEIDDNALLLTISQVVVGGSAGLVYSPDTIEAAIGDMVIFTFLEQNHTATQSAFTTPCQFLAGGIDSGFMPNINSSVNPPPQMAMQVTVATPICESNFFFLAPFASILILCRVLLQTKRSLRKGHDFLHQSNCQQDPSHVPADGHCSKRHRNYSSYCRWFIHRKHIYRRCCRLCLHSIGQHW
jgi:plastocyanin